MATKPIDWDALLPDHTSAYVGAVVMDGELRFRAVDDGVLVRNGLTREHMMTMTALDFVHPDDLARAAQSLAQSQKIDGTRMPAMYRLRVAGGRWEIFEVQGTNLGPDLGSALVMQIFEPTDEFMAEAFAGEVVDLLELLLTPGPIDNGLVRVADFSERHVRGLKTVISTYSPDGSIAVTSVGQPPASFAAATGAQPDALPTHVRRVLEANAEIDPYQPGLLDDEVPGRLTLAAVGDDGTPLGHLELYRPTVDPPSRQEWLVYSSIRRIVTTALDRRRLEQQLAHAADHDPMTGLLNRRRLLSEMNAASAPEGSAVLLIDLDNFSWINNRLGHEAGDRALEAVAESLRAEAPSEARVARWGGDEFVVWVARSTSIDEAHRLADDLRAAMVVPIDIADRRSTIRCSIGVTIFRADESAEEAINRADEAMYSAKRAGGNRAEPDRRLLT